MTVDGLILENLIRELITKEFTSLMKHSDKNSVEIDRLKQKIEIESQKLLDNTSRLKRLSDEFMQKSIQDK